MIVLVTNIYRDGGRVEVPCIESGANEAKTVLYSANVLAVSMLRKAFYQL